MCARGRAQLKYPPVLQPGQLEKEALALAAVMRQLAGVHQEDLQQADAAVQVRFKCREPKASVVQEAPCRLRGRSKPGAPPRRRQERSKRAPRGVCRRSSSLTRTPPPPRARRARRAPTATPRCDTGGGLSPPHAASGAAPTTPSFLRSACETPGVWCARITLHRAQVTARLQGLDAAKIAQLAGEVDGGRAGEEEGDDNDEEQDSEAGLDSDDDDDDALPEIDSQGSDDDDDDDDEEEEDGKEEEEDGEQQLGERRRSGLLAGPSNGDAMEEDGDEEDGACRRLPRDEIGVALRWEHEEARAHRSERVPAPLTSRVCAGEKVAGGALGHAVPVDDDAAVCASLFRGLVFFLAREVPREPLALVIRWGHVRA